MRIPFEAFLTDGTIGGLHIGDSMESVVGKLGEPDWWSGRGTRNYKDSDVWAYDDLSVVIINGHLERIAIYFTAGRHEYTPKLPSTIQQERIPFSSVTTIATFTEFLSCRGIRFEIEQGRFGATHVKCPKGATAIFRYTIDYHQSVAEERQITSEHKLLKAILVEGHLGEFAAQLA